MESYSDYLLRDTEFLIRRFRYVKLANLERMIRDTERRIQFLQYHKTELLNTRKGRAEQVEFMKMMSTKTEAEKLAMRFKVEPWIEYWIWEKPAQSVLIAQHRAAEIRAFPSLGLKPLEAEIRAFPASLRLKPQQAHLAQIHKDSLRLPHKARLPPAAPVACLDCPTNEALAQLKRSMALCVQMHGLDHE
jgi:hypothetical protein